MVRIIISKVIKLACNCLINRNLQDMICNLVIIDISISQKVFLFCSKLARKGETGQLAWKKRTPFCKISMFKNNYLVVLRTCKVVLS